MAVYTIDDVEWTFDVKYMPEQRIALQDVPFSEEILQECADTHLLFPGFPLSLVTISERVTDKCFSSTVRWYEEHGYYFVRQKIAVRWHLLRMNPVASSYGLTFEQQKELMLPHEDVPRASTLAFATKLHLKKTNVQLFTSCAVRTIDEFHYRRHAVFASDDIDGIMLRDCADECQQMDLGLAGERKN